MITHSSHPLSPGARPARVRAVGRVLRLLRLLSVLSKPQKSRPIAGPFLVNNLEKHRLKRANSSADGEDFCGTLMGPPAGARKSKTQQGPLAATRSGALHNDNATSNRPTSSGLCRLESERRHQAPRDRKQRRSRQALSPCRAALSAMASSELLAQQALTLTVA